MDIKGKLIYFLYKFAKKIESIQREGKQIIDHKKKKKKKKKFFLS